MTENKATSKPAIEKPTNASAKSPKMEKKNGKLGGEERPTKAADGKTPIVTP